MEDTVRKKAEIVPEGEFVEQKRTDTVPISPLPPSGDKGFWGEDSRMISVKVEDIERERMITRGQMSNHRIRLVGREFICSSCIYPHTLPLDPEKYSIDRNGEIIELDKNNHK